jgi:nucleoside phosphorylase
MASHDDLSLHKIPSQPEPLPPVDWASIGQTAPTPVSISPRRPGDPLPSADVVILTWSNAEWSALDHVFLGSAAARPATGWEWTKAWRPYSRGASEYHADPIGGELWGSFQLVRIFDQSRRPWRVLLFKSNSHLAHAPWIEGLSAMLRSILQDVRPDRIYSIGTAGGTGLHQALGDSVVTNSALLDLQRPENTSDPDKGKMFRCSTWFPASRLLLQVQDSLLFRMNSIVTQETLEDLFAELKATHAGHPGMDGVTLADLVNSPLHPDKLGAPRVVAMKDVPLLTTDYFYIAGGVESLPYSFLEMDDAVIAREAERAGVRYAFVRNVSDPAVNAVTTAGKPIAGSIRSAWSNAIYARFGFHTSYNGALATWATIAGEGEAAYNPARSTGFSSMSDPLEIKLAHQVRSCGTCSFFWPENKLNQPFGPYTAYDFDVNAPHAAAHKLGSASSPWILGRTRPPAYPEAEILNGCRKAPIMTIGINPNMTPFSPGRAGMASCYPTFFSDDGSNAWAKYAWYYRYRTAYQERLASDFVRRFILPGGAVYASRPGIVTGASRPDSNPAWSLSVRYQGDAEDTVIHLPGTQGDFPYMVLFDAHPPNNIFAAGDLLAGRLAVPGGIQAEIEQQPEGYYMQFVPVLQKFQQTLRQAGHHANLSMGEDVCELDMVACASPHWNPGFLGGSQQSIDTIVNNCVSHNAWAMKQLIQTRPAALYIVSESSWRMFRGSFGAHVRRDPPLSSTPVDHDFTLLRETTDANHPCNFVIDVEIDGMKYQCTTRIVITPHFSYDDNFYPQYRISQPDWQNFAQTQSACVAALTLLNGFTVVPANPKYPGQYVVIQLSSDAEKAAASRVWLQQQFPAAWQVLEGFYFEPRAMMAAVLDDLFKQGTLTWQNQDNGPGFLARTSGSCHFCVNQHWQFPQGCPYDKIKEQAPPAGFLEKVAQQVAATGKPPAAAAKNG